jgi:hypothetical protein
MSRPAYHFLSTGLTGQGSKTPEPVLVGKDIFPSLPFEPEGGLYGTY